MAGLAVPPLAIFPHELGHYLVLLAMEVPNLAMHYESVSWDSREFWEAIRREEADHCSLSLQERVQSDSRAVEEEAGATDSIRRETLLNRANHTLVGTL